MKVCVGPVAPTSAKAWIRWARESIGDLRREPGSAMKLPAQVLDHVSSYVETWAGATRHGDVFHWQVDVDPEQLEYLTNALYNLDRLADDAPEERSAPADARAFHVVLVRALLVALAQDSPGRAAFADQLRPSWPVAVDAR